ncbi:hypothetical protein DSO57_1002523 [Entomophthora muscae]|uniref:Uncharacterized protein n=1 Tax=Entomophthora muscae TaxID=34485 RepID=A0ACC2SLN0_9FUNG|nr:hypothetical protein DSO57_1002523 [Entomophthora muscae]
MLRVLVCVVLLVGALEKSSRVNGVIEIIESRSGNIRFECNITNLKAPEKIAKTRHGLKLAAEILENIIALKKRVTIKVDYFSRCNEQGCHPAELTASTYVTNSYVYDENNQVTIYPQALVGPYPEPPLYAPKQPDFVLELGSDLDFYYPSDYPTPILTIKLIFL